VSAITMSSVSWYSVRVKEQLGRKIAWVIARRLNDPRVPPVVTVTDVALSPDTRNATVYVSVLGDEKAVKGALIALNRAAGFIQGTVAENMSMKHFPRLYFKLDTSVGRGSRINELLDEVKDDLERS
jgi:ribosome-binding factor A